jgi:hypothetical protein
MTLQEQGYIAVDKVHRLQVVTWREITMICNSAFTLKD